MQRFLEQVLLLLPCFLLKHKAVDMRQTQVLFVTACRQRFVQQSLDLFSQDNSAEIQELSRKFSGANVKIQIFHIGLYTQFS